MTETVVNLPYGHGSVLQDFVSSEGLFPKQMYGFICGSLGRQTIFRFCTPVNELGRGRDMERDRWIKIEL